jgi:molecular chaperone GrpE (heat shock protein)
MDIIIDRTPNQVTATAGRIVGYYSPMLADEEIEKRFAARLKEEGKAVKKGSSDNSAEIAEIIEPLEAELAEKDRKIEELQAEVERLKKDAADPVAKALKQADAAKDAAPEKFTGKGGNKK